MTDMELLAEFSAFCDAHEMTEKDKLGFARLLMEDIAKETAIKRIDKVWADYDLQGGIPDGTSGINRLFLSQKIVENAAKDAASEAMECVYPYSNVDKYIFNQIFDVINPILKESEPDYEPEEIEDDD